MKTFTEQDVIQVKRRNPVAKHAIMGGAGYHSDPKRSNRQDRRESKQALRTQQW
jgi:hypothetical protein